MRDKQINAVYDKKLLEFLRSIGEEERFLSGDLRCEFCNTAMHGDNIHAIFPQNNTVKYCCRAAECVMRMTSSVK